MRSVLTNRKRDELVRRTTRQILDALIAARDDRSQETVAEQAVGRGRQWLSKVESGTLDVALTDLVALCLSLGLCIRLEHCDDPRVSYSDRRRAPREVREFVARLLDERVSDADRSFAVRVLRALQAELTVEPARAGGRR